MQINITNSSSESEASSESSAEFSHVPVDNAPNLQNLFLSDSEKTDMDADQLIAQINNLSQVLEAMRNQQQQQQQLIDALSQGQANAAAAAQNNVQVQRNANSAFNVESLFKIPDPIKSIPKFDGNRKQLSAWLTTAENTLARFRNLVSQDQYEIFVTAVTNKIEGKAKDIICLAGNPQSFEEVRDILTNALGDRQELTYYKSQLWQTKMGENTSVHKHYNRCKEIVQSIKTLAKQNDKYKRNWDAINAFIDEDALAAFLAGLKEPYFGYAQAAKPEDMEAAYAFVCKFKSRESTSSHMAAEQKSYVKNHKFRTYTKQGETGEHQDHKKSYYTKPENRDDEKAATPMEVGSVRSRLTLNKRQIHNREIADDEESSESEKEEENIDLNFCWGQTNKKGT